MAFLESQLSKHQTGIYGNKRIITFDHEFNTVSPNLDLDEIVNLQKNSYLQILKLIICFNYAKAVIPGAEYYTNYLNYSGRFLMEIEDAQYGNILTSFQIPIKNIFELNFDNMFFDEDSIKAIRFNAENSSLIAFKEGATNIASTIEKIGITLYCEMFDYAKELYEVQGNRIVYRNKK